jgi:hypothetical protein
LQVVLYVHIKALPDFLAGSTVKAMTKHIDNYVQLLLDPNEIDMGIDAGMFKMLTGLSEIDITRRRA